MTSKYNGIWECVNGEGGNGKGKNYKFISGSMSLNGNDSEGYFITNQIMTWEVNDEEFSITFKAQGLAKHSEGNTYKFEHHKMTNVMPPKGEYVKLISLVFMSQNEGKVHQEGVTSSGITYLINYDIKKIQQ